MKLSRGDGILMVVCGIIFFLIDTILFRGIGGPQSILFWILLVFSFVLIIVGLIALFSNSKEKPSQNA